MTIYNRVLMQRLALASEIGRVTKGLLDGTIEPEVNGKEASTDLDWLNPLAKRFDANIRNWTKSLSTMAQVASKRGDDEGAGGDGRK